MGLNYLSASVVVGQTTSNRIILGENNTPVGITTGSNITGTVLTFLVSNDNITYVPLYDDTSTEDSLTVTTDARAYSFLPTQTWPWRFIKIREGNSASAVAQATVNTLFTIVSKKLI